MLERVAATIDRYRMLSSGDRLGVAVSGGADSVFLLHILRLLAPRWNLELTAVHLNHRLRGAEADADEAFVRELAASLHVRFIAESADIQTMSGNLEEAGRLARRALFTRLIQAGDLTKVATGHTRSDQAETVLYRLLRGAGPAGLRGILPKTAEGFIRPLIDCDRTEIESWLTTNGHRWREDRSNLDPRFARNRIRHSLLPQLEREGNHNLLEVLSHTAQVAQDEEDYWSQQVAGLSAALFLRDRGAVILDVRRLARLPRAVNRRVVRAAVAEVKGNLRRIDFRHVEAVLDFAERTQGDGRIDLPGLSVVRSFDWLRFAADSHENRVRFAWELAIPGRVKLPRGGVLEIQVLAAPPVYNERNSQNADAEKISGPLAIRNWEPGDRIETSAGRLRKLKDLFQQARIPIWDRQGWPVVTSGETIIWTSRFGTAARFRPRPETRQMLRFLPENASGESIINSPTSNHIDTLRL